MADQLTAKKCGPCEGGIPPMSPGHYAQYLDQVPDWRVVDQKALARDYDFKNFKRSMEFVNRVADLAESEGHHPDILVHDWNHVRLTLTTFAIGGLSINDFILAAKIDQL